MLDQPERIAARLTELAQWLEQHKHVWTHRTFVQLPAPWEEQYGQVARWLRSRSDAQVEQLHVDPTQLAGGAANLHAWWTEGQRLTSLASAELGFGDALRDPELRRGVRKRKWRQVEALVSSVASSVPSEASCWVDWCSGKGHLGRVLASVAPRPVVFVDRREELCRAASIRAEREHLAHELRVCDVLTASPSLPPGAALTSLHACGALTDAALDAAEAQQAASLAVSPCCYHYQPGCDRITPRSTVARGLDLGLSRQQLRFATAEETLAPARLKRRRRRAEAYRLGLDQLVRQATGRDEYTRVSAVPKKLVDGSFRGFVEHAAAIESLPLPSAWDADEAERAGWQLARNAARLSLARVPFRRPLELWFVLDRAMSLVERGWSVRVEAFCERAVSPRNLAILARRS